MGNYVNNKEIMAEMILYKETGKISDRLGEMYFLICSNLSQKSSFCNYTWREDMVADAVLTIVKYGKSFDPEKSNNPFGYISKIAKNAFIAYIKKQNRHSDIKQSLFDNKHLIDEDSFYSYQSLNYEDLLDRPSTNDPND